MKLDFHTSLGILCAVTSLTCVGCRYSNGSNVAVQEISKESEIKLDANELSVILTPSNVAPQKTTGHTSHGAHLSHASHSSHVSHASHSSSRF